MTAGENTADTPITGPPTPAGRTTLVPTWVRVLVVLTVLPAWVSGVLYSLFVLGKLPDVVWMAIPSSVIVAVAPAWNLPGRPGRGGGT